MAKVMVVLTAFNAEGYRKRLATLSAEQIHMTTEGVREVGIGEIAEPGAIEIAIDRSEFTEADRFVISVKSVQ